MKLLRMGTWFTIIDHHIIWNRKEFTNKTEARPKFNRHLHPRGYNRKCKLYVHLRYNFKKMEFWCIYTSIDAMENGNLMFKNPSPYWMLKAFPSSCIQQKMQIVCTSMS